MAAWIIVSISLLLPIFGMYTKHHPIYPMLGYTEVATIVVNQDTTLVIWEKSDTILTEIVTANERNKIKESEK